MKTVSLLNSIFVKNKPYAFLILKHKHLPLCLIRHIITKYVNPDPELVQIKNLFKIVDYDTCKHKTNNLKHKNFIYNCYYSGFGKKYDIEDICIIFVNEERIHVDSKFSVSCLATILKLKKSLGNLAKDNFFLNFVKNYLLFLFMKRTQEVTFEDLMQTEIPLFPNYIQHRINLFCESYTHRKLDEIIALKKAIVKHQNAIKSASAKIDFYIK